MGYNLMTQLDKIYTRQNCLINRKMIFRILGILLGLEGIMFLVCAGVSMLYRESSYIYFIYSTLIAVVAGGILLLIMAVDLVLGNPEPAMNNENKEERKESMKRTDISVFPLAIPLLSGPATITMLTICMKNAQGNVIDRSLIIAALFFNLVVCWLILKFSSKVSKLLGKTGVSVINRIVGILLAAMSCEFLMTGLIDIIKSAR